jgi:predicted phosphodiesterase
MAAEPILVLSSDWHLHPLPWKRHPLIKHDSYYSLSQIVDLAIHLRVPLVGAGDLFDVNRPHSESVVFCSEQMQRLAAFDLPMYYVQGQHEYQTPTWLSLCPNAVHIDSKLADGPTKVFNIKGLKVIGMDIVFNGAEFQSHCYRLKEEAGLNKFDLFVTHQVWGDFIHKRDPAFMLQNATFAKIIYTGDFHKKEVIEIDGTFCLSSGSINMQANNESPHKSVFILYDDLSFTEHPIKTRPFANFEIRTEADLERLVSSDKAKMLEEWPYDNLPEHIGRPLVCIKYQNTLKNAFAALSEKFKDWSYDINPTDFSSNEMTAAVERKQIKDLVDIRDCVAQFASADSKVHSDAVRVFNSSHIEQELDNMRKEHLNNKGE